MPMISYAKFIVQKERCLNLMTGCVDTSPTPGHTDVTAGVDGLAAVLASPQPADEVLRGEKICWVTTKKISASIDCMFEMCFVTVWCKLMTLEPLGKNWGVPGLSGPLCLVLPSGMATQDRWVPGAPQFMPNGSRVLTDEDLKKQVQICPHRQYGHKFYRRFAYFLKTKQVNRVRSKKILKKHKISNRRRGNLWMFKFHQII